MEEEKFILFWNGTFSQWVESPFKDPKSGLTFNCAEQWMMWNKATLFEDTQSAIEILATSNPREQKKLGKIVQNFDVRVWDNFKFHIVYMGSYLKYSQNLKMKQELMDTEGTTLVEASPYDKIWGIGLGAGEPDALIRANWKGENLLGEALTQLRQNFGSGYHG